MTLVVDHTRGSPVQRRVDPEHSPAFLSDCEERTDGVARELFGAAPAAAAFGRRLPAKGGPAPSKATVKMSLTFDELQKMGYEQAFAAHPQVRSLDFSKSQITDVQCATILQAAQAVGSCLESLNFSGCTQLTKVPALPRDLLHLKLKDCSNLKGMLDVQVCRYLQTLDLEGCSSLNKLNELKGLSQLEQLNLRGCQKFFGAFALLNLKECKQLQQLDLSHTGFKGELNITQLEQLQQLRLENCLVERLLLPTKNQLEEIHLIGCSALSGELHLAKLSQLLKLTIRNCDSLTSIVLDSLLHVRELTLENLATIEGVRIASMSLQGKLTLPGCGTLETLSLLGCHRIQDIDVQHVTRLTALSITDCKGLYRLCNLGKLFRMGDGLQISLCPALIGGNEVKGISFLQKNWKKEAWETCLVKPRDVHKF